jgi:hypothetical protein
VRERQRAALSVAGTVNIAIIYHIANIAIIYHIANMVRISFVSV